MDLLPAIIGAQTYRGAIERVQQATGLDERGAWAAIKQAVSGGAWAVLVAPELWLVLEEHFATARLSLDLEQLRALRDHVQTAALSPRALAVVEVKTGKVFEIPDGKYVGEVKVGRDILSDRATAASKVQDSITRLEAELARRREALGRYVLAYQARTSEVATMRPEEQARELLRSALLAGRLELARELAQVTSAKAASQVTGEGFFEAFAGRVRGLVTGGST